MGAAPCWAAVRTDYSASTKPFNVFSWFFKLDAAKSNPTIRSRVEPLDVDMLIKVKFFIKKGF